ncbi:MAG: phosphotransferase, partial [Chloroflexi bacterium]|nr:phosphotransferase [Chloroflexota bacterium]
MQSVVFESGHLSGVYGARLRDGRDVVVKVRRWEPRLVGCAQVQQALWEAGFPCPRVLAGPDRLGDLAISAEAMVVGGTQLLEEEEKAERFAVLFARLLRLAPQADDVAPVRPALPWTAWDHGGAALWPEPDEAVGDLNELTPDWLDDVAHRARARLCANREAEVLGHGDFESQNIRWVGTDALVVHDWDSVVARPECTLVGLAAAVFAATGAPGAATVAD